jgi:hypothetical protein
MTEPQSPFEDVPVVRIARPPDARRVQVGTIVVLAALVVLVIKPWGEPVGRRTAAASIAPTPSATAAAVPRPVRTPRPDGARQYDPALFGRFTVVPRWELWPTLYVYQFGLSGPMSIDGGGAQGVQPPPLPTPTAEPPESASPPPGASQLIDVGSADLLMVLGLDTPAESRVLDARLWRFPVDGAPVRMALVALPPPWPVPYFHVYGLPVPGTDEADLVAMWPAGTYRLDLLVDPGAEIRRIGLLVRPPVSGDQGSPPPIQPASDVVDPAALRDLGPDQMALGGADGTWGVANLDSTQSCALPELWLAEQDRPGIDPCRSILASRDVRMIGVRLGPDRPIRGLSLQQVDPDRRSVPVADVTAAVRLTSGGALVVSADGGRPLAEGTYRVVATLVDGTERGWYVRVPPRTS